MNIGTETEQIEFKKTTGELKEGIISIGAMLNKHGSCDLYFGVRNDGEAVGQQIGNDTLREISQAVANSIKPQIIPTISVEFIGDKNIIKVSAAGNDRPYSAYGKYYLRSADEDREVSPALLRSMMFPIGHSLVSIESNNQNLTFSQLRLLYVEKGLTLHDDTFANNLHLLTQTGKYNLMANILSDNNSFSIKVAKFKGTDKTELITRNEYGYKCLLVAIRQVLDYAEAINETAVEISGGLRKETKLFDQDAFREAWLNACLHNRWDKQAPPAVYFFQDRIEIISIGGLPEDYSLEDFYAGRSRPINLELQQIMVQLNYIEQTGHGVPLIVSKYGRQAFDITENFITVTIPLRSTAIPVRDEEVVATPKAPPTATQNRILALIATNPRITIAEMAAQLHLSSSAINNAIKDLKGKQMLSRHGSNKNGYWQVNT